MALCCVDSSYWKKELKCIKAGKYDSIILSSVRETSIPPIFFFFFGLFRRDVIVVKSVNVKVMI